MWFRVMHMKSNPHSLSIELSIISRLMIALQVQLWTKIEIIQCVFLLLNVKY